jgi:hypothetical protein
MRKKMTLSILVIALAMLLSFGSALDQANADSILFPWVVKSGAISTIVSVVNTAGIPLPYSSALTPQLHYSYFYKEDPANTQTGTCQDYNFKVDTSEMDVLTSDASAIINGGLPMWGDANNGVTSLALLAGGDRRAFLIVDNNTPNLTFAASNIDGTLYGEAMVIELATGAAWGYEAYNTAGPLGNDSYPAATSLINPPGQGNPMTLPPAGTCTAGQNGFVSFTNGLDLYGDVIGRFHTVAVNPLVTCAGTTTFVAGEMAPITLMPPSDVSTKMFMTPTDMISAAIAFAPPPCNCGTTQWANQGQRNGNINTRVGVCAIPEIGGVSMAYPIPGVIGQVGGTLTGNCLLPGIRTNDEKIISSTKLKNIVCTSADDFSALIDAATLTAWETNGGNAWTYMRTAMGNLTPAASYQYSPNMMIGKLEWVDNGLAGTSTIDHATVAGTFNNFIQVRSNLVNFVAPAPFGDNNLAPQPH